MAAISSLLKLPLPSLSRSLKFLLRLTRMPVSYTHLTLPTILLV